MMMGELLIVLEKIVRWCWVTWGGFLLGATMYLWTR